MHAGLGESKTWENIWDIIKGWSQTGQEVVRARNVPRGMYVERGEEGEIIYVQPEGSGEDIFGHHRVTGRIGTDVTAYPKMSSATALLLAVGVAFVLILAIRPSRSRPASGT